MGIDFLFILGIDCIELSLPQSCCVGSVVCAVFGVLTGVDEAELDLSGLVCVCTGTAACWCESQPAVYP